MGTRVPGPASPSSPASAGGADATQPFPATEDSSPIEFIGRYRVEKTLGQGGFGVVYLAHDSQLNRRVAIKVPRSFVFSCPDDAKLYMAEARTVAGLDHPHIVPVFDVGSSTQHPCFIVSKYIEGADLQ